MLSALIDDWHDVLLLVLINGDKKRDFLVQNQHKVICFNWFVIWLTDKQLYDWLPVHNLQLYTIEYFYHV